MRVDVCVNQTIIGIARMAVNHNLHMVLSVRQIWIHTNTNATMIIHICFVTQHQHHIHVPAHPHIIGLLPHQNAVSKQINLFMLKQKFRIWSILAFKYDKT